MLTYDYQAFYTLLGDKLAGNSFRKIDIKMRIAPIKNTPPRTKYNVRRFISLSCFVRNMIQNKITNMMHIIIMYIKIFESDCIFYFK